MLGQPRRAWGAGVGQVGYCVMTTMD
jgi:hypothetical protein